MAQDVGVRASGFASSRNENFCVDGKIISVGMEKVEYIIQRSSVCSQTFTFKPRVSFTFQPVELEILAKWKAPSALHENLCEATLTLQMKKSQEKIVRNSMR